MLVNRALNRKLALGFGTLGLTLLALVTVAGISFARLGEANYWNTHTYQVFIQIQGMRQSLDDIQLGARGYALLGDGASLQSLTRGRTEFENHFRTAQVLTMDRLAQQERLRRLEAEQQAWSRLYVQPLLALRQGAVGGTALPAQIRHINVNGQPRLDSLQRTLEDMTQTESMLLKQRAQDEVRRRTATAAILVTGGLVAVLMTVALAMLLTTNTRQLFAANDELAAEVTERQEAQAALQLVAQQLEQANQANQRVLNYSLDVICTIDEAGRYSQMSPACEKVWGYRSDELIGRQYIDFVYSEDVPRTNQAALAVLAGQASADFENRYVRKDGVPVSMVWSAVWSEADKTMFCVARDNTERKQAEVAVRYAVSEAERARAEAEQAKAEADQANHAKSEFLSRISHELRTPMNAILGFGQLLEIDDTLDPEQQESVEQILKRGRHLLELINEVLDISRIETGQLTLSSEPVRVREVVQEVMALVRPLMVPARITLQDNLAAAPDCYVMADCQRLRQVLLNLFSNAIKYNRQHGTIVCSCEVWAEKWIRIGVRDTGPGLPAEKLPRLFSAFDRLDAEQTGVEGTGLGLTLSKRLTEAMGGTIEVASTPSVGSTFWVVLPLVADPHAPHGLDKQWPAGDSARDKTPTASRLTPLPTRCMLYIEDNISNLRLVERIVARRPQFKLLSTMQGRIGLDLAREHRPDLILLDLHLPDMLGDEVLQQLRSAPVTRAIPVVMLSADATDGQIQRLLDAGAKAYLTKPIEIKKLLEVLDDI